MPNPSCQRYSQFEFVGRLMAGAIQTEENVVAYWPPFVWKLLSGFTPSEADYASGIDQSVATYAVRKPSLLMYTIAHHGHRSYC